MENSEGQLEPRGYHTSPESGLHHVPVRHMTLNRATGNYEFIADGDTTPSIYWNPNKLDLEVPQHTGNEDRPYLPPSITVLPLPEEASDNIEIYTAPEENGFQDYILILPIPNMPPIYIYLSKSLDNKSKKTTFTTKQLDKKFKHAADFGVVTTKKNTETIAEYQSAIELHVDNEETYEYGTYLLVPESKVLFNPKTNNLIVIDKSGNFVSGWKLDPQIKQYDNFIKNGALK